MKKASITLATAQHLDFLQSYDSHISKEELLWSIKRKRVYLIWEGETIAGFLRYNLFWDNSPFMNMLWIVDKYRRCGYGRFLVTYWESAMKQKEHSLVMTSTLSSENAQHFYRTLGYDDCGGFILPQEPTELLFYKKL